VLPAELTSTTASDPEHLGGPTGPKRSVVSTRLQVQNNSLRGRETFEEPFTSRIARHDRVRQKPGCGSENLPPGLFASYPHICSIDAESLHQVRSLG